MKPTFNRPLATSIAAALALALLAPAANAQQDPTATTGTKTMRQQRAERMAELGKGKEEAKQAEDKPAAYPNATRTQPDAKSSGKMIKNLQGLQELFEKRDMTAVIARAEEIVAMPSANAYDKSFAYSLAANAAADQDDQAKAAEYFRRAVDANGLDNDSHYTTMFNLAVIQFGLEKYAEALATVDRFLAESKSEKPEHQSFRAGILANLERHDEAAAIYKDLIAKNPNDKRILMNAVAALQNADKQDQALYIGYMNASRWDDTQKVIDAGVSKGVLQPGPDLARDYQILAQNAYADDKIPLAIDLYGKAAPMAADGEAYLNLAKVLEYSGKKAEAKAAAQKALDKGVKKPEEAKGILSR